MKLPLVHSLSRVAYQVIEGGTRLLSAESVC
jgi:hypothetical protein